MFGFSLFGETLFGDSGLEGTRFSVVKAVRLKFRFTTSVSRSVGLPYDVKDGITSSVALPYDVKAGVSNSVELLFDANGVLQKGVELSYYMQEPWTGEAFTKLYFQADGVAIKGIGLGYKVYNSVDEQVGLPFNVLQAVESGIEFQNKVYAYSFIVNQNKSLVLGKNKQIAVG